MSTEARPRTLGSAKLRRSTWTPIITKKIGTRRSARGRISSSSSCRPLPLGELAILHLLEDQARGEGADDRGQAHLRGEPGEAEADRQGRTVSIPLPWR